MNQREAKIRAINIAVSILKDTRDKILDHIDDDTTDEEGEKIGKELDSVIHALDNRVYWLTKGRLG